MAVTVQREPGQPLRRVFTAMETATLPHPALPSMTWHIGSQRFWGLTASTLPYIDMDTPFPAAAFLDCSHHEYESAFTALERRAARGEFTPAP